VATLGHFLEVVADLRGGERRQALFEIGRAAADMTARTGRFTQLDVKRPAVESASEVLRYGRLVTSVITAFYNFSRMSFGPHRAEPQAFQIDWYDVADLPESNRFCAEGFIDRVARHAAAIPMKVESNRPTPEHIVFTLRAAG
jgi:hypothetical protein